MVDIRIVELEQQQVAVRAEKVPMNRLTEYFDRAFSSVMTVTGHQGVPITGPPFARYHGIPTETVDVEAGFPTASVVEAEEGVLPAVLPAGRAIEAMHVGPYDSLSQTYGEALQWAGERGLSPSGDMWEEYLSDPSESEPSTWRTRVLIPVG